MFDPSEVEHGFQPPPPPPPAEVAQAAAASEQVELPSEEAQQQAEQASPSSPEQTPSAAQAAQAPSPHQAPFSAPQPNGTPGYYAAQPAQYNPGQYQAPYQVTYYSQQVPPRRRIPISRFPLPLILRHSPNISRRDWPLLLWCWESAPLYWEAWCAPF